MKILIVEDDRDYRAMLYEFLHSEEHEVLAVSDALHAIALLNEAHNGIELALLDIKMPRLGGDAIMDTFTSWNRCSTSFIVMSGEPDSARYESHPAVIAFLSKPFSFQELKQQIRKAETRLADAVHQPVAV